MRMSLYTPLFFAIVTGLTFTQSLQAQEDSWWDSVIDEVSIVGSAEVDEAPSPFSLGNSDSNSLTATDSEVTEKESTFPLGIATGTNANAPQAVPEYGQTTRLPSSNAAPPSLGENQHQTSPAAPHFIHTRSLSHDQLFTGGFGQPSASGSALLDFMQCGEPAAQQAWCGYAAERAMAEARENRHINSGCGYAKANECGSCFQGHGCFTGCNHDRRINRYRSHCLQPMGCGSVGPACDSGCGIQQTPALGYTPVAAPSNCSNCDSASAPVNHHQSMMTKPQTDKADGLTANRRSILVSDSNLSSSPLPFAPR